MYHTERKSITTLRDLNRACLSDGLTLPSLVAANTPVSIRIIFWVSIFLLLAFGFSLLLLPWQQVSIGQGKVISYSSYNRQQDIEAPITGRVQKWQVQEGETVKMGEALAELSDFDPQILERIKRQRDAVQQRLLAAEEALKVSKRNLARKRELASKGLSSQRDYELAQLEITKYQADLSSAQSESAELEVKLSRQSSQTIVAPYDGTLVKILIAEGSAVAKAGEKIAILVPDTEDRAVELTVSGRDLPLISPGRKVRLQFEGWPAVQFSGWPSVAVGTFGGEVKIVDAIDDGFGNYRVIVFPDNQDQPWPSVNYLRQGVRSIGWILLDQVSLGWELWRKLNGFPMTVTRRDTTKEAPDSGTKSSP